MDVYEDRSFRTNFAVGLFMIALVAGLLAGAAFFLQKDSPLAATYPIEVRFADVAGLKEGAPVALMGAHIGRVDALTLAPPRPPRFPKSAWAARLAIRDESWIRERLTTATTFTIVPESLFGNKYVNASFGDGGEPLLPRATVQGEVGAGVDARTFEKLSTALENFSEVAAELRGFLAVPAGATGTAAPPNLRDALAKLDTTLANASDATQVLKEALSTENQAQVKQTFNDLSASASNLAVVTERMKVGMDSWNETLERMRFWRGWFGGNDREKKEEKKDEKKDAGKAKEER